MYLEFRSVKTALLAGVVFVALPGLALAQSGPSSDELMASGTDSSNWVLPAGNYSGNRQVSESEISRENADKLKVAWTFKIPDKAPVEASPIIWDGMMYITSSHDDVYALDAKTGEMKWQYNPKPDQLVGFSRNRGVAVYDGKVFIGLINGHMAALDAKTGKELWNKQTVENPENSFYTMQPVPYKGMILLGVSNGDWGGIGNISAFDPKTGERIWKWNSIPGPGEPGHETWSGESWKRGGGAIWSGLSIDPKSDTLYVSVGNPQPDFLGAARAGDNLYTDSMVALDISGDQPKVKWHYQFTPHDTHDWDPAMPPVLFTGNIDGKDVDLAAAGDKAGNFWILNAKTGELVSKTAVSFQYHQDVAPPQEGKNYACPNTNGGVEYNGGAYDPATNTFFVPSTDQCGEWSASNEARYIAGQFYLGGSFPKLAGKNSGWFNAINVDGGYPAWRHHLDLPANGGALVMDYDGGNATDRESLVFSGMLDGMFNVYDGQSGELLWSHDTGASIIAPPATFTSGGNRYVAVASGDPGFLKVPELTREIGPAVLTTFVSASSESAQTN